MGVVVVVGVVVDAILVVVAVVVVGVLVDVVVVDNFCILAPTCLNIATWSQLRQK